MLEAAKTLTGPVEVTLGELVNRTEKLYLSCLLAEVPAQILGMEKLRVKGALVIFEAP